MRKLAALAGTVAATIATLATLATLTTLAASGQQPIRGRWGAVVATGSRRT